MSLGEAQAALLAAQEQVAELNDKYLRAAAAVENARKQGEREATQRMGQRLRSFATGLIEVADNLERALMHAPPDDPLRTGVQATYQQLQVALASEGITPITVAPGDPFDPHRQEAISGQEADVEQDTVSAVLQTGYVVDGQVLRPARVIVAHPRRPAGNDQ
ncbi:MAG: nucleotide exchange factor GrpE [Chloroflexaceae bacterium]|jgi:molecular chaperone GrpE|nr:nucleotide exchange factor GrpE [Chloroflexaceae bacterium]